MKFVLALTVVAFLLLVPFRANAATDTVVQRVAGEVWILRPFDGGDDRFTVHASLVLPENATAVTGMGARARVIFADSSFLLLDGATRAHVGRFSTSGLVPATIRLTQGSLRIHVRITDPQREYAIATTNLEVHVSGTASVRTDDTSTRVACVSGKATLASRNGLTYEIHEGQIMTQTWSADGMMEMHLDPMQ